MNFWCKLFGHKFTELDVLIAKIELKAYIAPQPKILCKRCGVDIIQEVVDTKYFSTLAKSL